MNKLAHLNNVAVAKVIKTDVAKEAISKLSPGEYKIDALLHIYGSLKRGENYEQVCHVKATPWALLAVAMSKINNVTLESITREAMDAPEDKIDQVKKQAEEAIEKFKEKKGKMTYSGKITTKLMIEEVTANELSDIVPQKKKKKKTKTEASA